LLKVSRIFRLLFRNPLSLIRGRAGIVMATMTPATVGWTPDFTNAAQNRFFP
jgi:enoyl reductase-like protein